jgi:hypothetical protein
MVRETTDFIVLLGTADKSNGKLRIWSDHSLQRLCGKHSLSLFLASSGRGNEILIFILTLLCGITFLLHVTKALKEFKVEWHSFRAIVDQESWVFTALTHIESAKVQ